MLFNFDNMNALLRKLSSLEEEFYNNHIRPFWEWEADADPSKEEEYKAWARQAFREKYPHLYKTVGFLLKPGYEYHNPSEYIKPFGV